MRPETSFCHLQVHSHFTLLGGTASVADLVDRAAAEGMSHLALTDTNGLYGVVAFEQACQAAGIHPIIGMTATVAPSVTWPDPVGSPGRVVLLATNPAGYRSLCRLSSQIQADSQREDRAARGLSWSDLEAHRDGLICLSGGRMGWVERLLRAGDSEAAFRSAALLAEIYGHSAYLSVEQHRPEDRSLAEAATALGQRLGLRTVAVQPVYCLLPEDVPRLRLLAAIDHNIPLDAVPPSALPAHGDCGVDLHWLGREAVAARFDGFPEALSAIEEVTGQCGPILPDGSPIWPDLKLPNGQSPDRALAELAKAGLERKIDPGSMVSAGQRLQAELVAIAQHGYAPLFLVVADIARFARDAEIPMNTRGSVANSLVAYCSDITNVDPVEHDLLFERFLNPARADLPDIDLDFCSRRRDEVLSYVRGRYGEEHVALVSTVSTLQPRAAAREVAKAYGLDEAQAARLAVLMPQPWHPALRFDPGAGNQRRRDGHTLEDTLARLEDPRLKEVLRAAYSLIGQPHHLSVHPGGVVITPGPLTDVVPLQWAPKGFLITQFDHKDVELLGLPKLDLLGIRALTVLADAERLVKRHYDPGFHLTACSLDDPQTAALLTRAETIGVFQCESVGAQRTLRQLRVRTVRDLAVANAFFKPGPATGGMAQEFVRRYRGEQPVDFLHPALAPILGSTMGVLLFQEQVLRVAREIAGLSWQQADQLRRGMSHFGHEEMAAIQAQFVAGCQRPAPDGPGFTRYQAERLWVQVLAFAGYGFNQGHATSYAAVSYRMAFLKAHWPAAFLCARLAEWGGFHHPAIYQAEAVRLGLAVRPPHVNHSGIRFTLSTDGAQAILWMGLGQVRDLRQASIRAITAERQSRPYTGLRDLLARVPLQGKEITHLIQCGALDGLGASRAALLAEEKEIRQAGSALQMAFEFATRAGAAGAGEPAVAPEPAAQRLAWELHLLGQPVSVHPLDLVRDRLPEHVPLRQLPESSGRRVAVVGVRLPGWTGGQGFFLGDGDSFIVAKDALGQKAPPAWRPLLVHGRWGGDEWGAQWLQVEDAGFLAVEG